MLLNILIRGDGKYQGIEKKAKNDFWYRKVVFYMAITGVAFWRLNYMRKKTYKRRNRNTSAKRAQENMRMIKENTGTDSMI
jgi:hypothetical protein